MAQFTEVGAGLLDPSISARKLNMSLKKKGGRVEEKGRVWKYLAVNILRKLFPYHIPNLL